MTTGSDNMQVTNNGLSKKWVLMDGHENLMRIGAVKLANEKNQDKNSFNEFSVRQAEKWSRNLFLARNRCEINGSLLCFCYLFIFFCLAILGLHCFT